MQSFGRDQGLQQDKLSEVYAARGKIIGDLVKRMLCWRRDDRAYAIEIVNRCYTVVGCSGAVASRRVGYDGEAEAAPEA